MVCMCVWVRAAARIFPKNEKRKTKWSNEENRFRLKTKQKTDFSLDLMRQQKRTNEGTKKFVIFGANGKCEKSLCQLHNPFRILVEIRCDARPKAECSRFFVVFAFWMDGRTKFRLRNSLSHSISVSLALSQPLFLSLALLLSRYIAISLSRRVINVRDIFILYVSLAILLPLLLSWHHHFTRCMCLHLLCIEPLPSFRATAIRTFLVV